MPTVDKAEGKAEQRARNGNATRSGSSGAALAIKNFPHLEWEEVEDVAEHLTDLAGKISHTQVGAAGQAIATINVPLEYAHSLLETHMNSRDAMVYIRVYHVTQERFLEVQRERLAALLGQVGENDD